MRVDTWLKEHRDLPRLDLELLLGDRLNATRASVIAHPERILAADTLQTLNSDTTRLHNAEPLAYILGCREFYGLDLQVTPNVLIPRPETELVVERALIAIHHRIDSSNTTQPVRLLDLATGSGAIVIAIASQLGAQTPCILHASDVSEAALSVAQGNADRHEATVTFIASDWFAAMREPYDVIVSNPPYVAEADPHLPALRHEPQQALISGPDGLDALSRIIQQAPDHLTMGGALILEHGFDQADAVRRMMNESFNRIETHRDLGGHNRVTQGERK